VPRISAVYGIVIRMYQEETRPRAAGQNRSSAPTGDDYDPTMRSTPLLLEATPLDGYVVHVRFDDGVEADVDLGYLRERGGVFAPLRDPVFFRRLVADREAGTIVWPNDADIASETLYDRACESARAVT
jgi:hypothetical protein